MKLTAQQLSNTVSQYCVTLTNNMRREDLVAYISSTMLHSLLHLDEEELDETIANKYDMNLFKQLATDCINKDITTDYKSIPTRY